MYWSENCRHCFYYCKSNFTILICCQYSDSGVKLKFQLAKLNWFPSIKFTNTPDFYPGLRSPAFRVSSGHIQDTRLERFRERQDPTQEYPLQCRRTQRDVSFLVVFVVVAGGSYSEPVCLGWVDEVFENNFINSSSDFPDSKQLPSAYQIAS